MSWCRFLNAYIRDYAEDFPRIYYHVLAIYLPTEVVYELMVVSLARELSMTFLTTPMLVRELCAQAFR